MQMTPFPINSLPKDVLQAVFCRAASLKPIRSVCKRWAAIASPETYIMWLCYHKHTRTLNQHNHYGRIFHGYWTHKITHLKLTWESQSDQELSSMVKKCHYLISLSLTGQPPRYPSFFQALTHPTLTKLYIEDTQALTDVRQLPPQLKKLTISGNLSHYFNLKTLDNLHSGLQCLKIRGMTELNTDFLAHYPIPKLLLYNVKLPPAFNEHTTNLCFLLSDMNNEQQQMPVLPPNLKYLRLCAWDYRLAPKVDLRAISFPASLIRLSIGFHRQTFIFPETFPETIKEVVLPK